MLQCEGRLSGANAAVFDEQRTLDSSSAEMRDRNGHGPNSLLA